METSRVNASFAMINQTMRIFSNLISNFFFQFHPDFKKNCIRPEEKDDNHNASTMKLSITGGLKARREKLKKAAKAAQKK